MSVPYLGDFAEDATVYMPFNTFTSDDPAISATITNLAAADIKVHKDGAVAQIVTDGATIAIDFDGITGNHLITIDTSVHADYAVGSDYHVRVEGTTIDGGANINFWVGHFSIENRYSAGALRPTTAGRTLDVTATGAAGIDWGNVENATTAVDLSGTDIQLVDTATVATTATNLTNMPTIPANWITAAGIAADAITEAKIADNAIAAEHIAASAIDNATFAADVGTTAYATNNIALAANKALDDAMVETTGAPAVTGTFRAALEWMFALSRNKITQTATTTTLRNDADSADLATSTVSDDATTYTRGEWST